MWQCKKWILVTGLTLPQSPDILSSSGNCCGLLLFKLKTDYHNLMLKKKCFCTTKISNFGTI